MTQQQIKKIIELLNATAGDYKQFKILSNIIKIELNRLKVEESEQNKIFNYLYNYFNSIKRNNLTNA